MRVGLLQEGDFANTTLHARYREMIKEATRADQLGFSSWGTSEQHFSPPHFSVASPEVLYAAVAENTSRITLRNMAAVLVAYNHPIMVAERISTLDLISNGRAELCTARSNNLRTLETFEVPTHNTADQWAESVEIVIKAMSEQTLEYHGEFWDIKPCEVIPKPLQRPHPAVSVAATSLPSHRKAGRRGLGVISFDNYFGYGYLDECIREYAQGLEEHGADAANNYFGVYVASAFCAPSRDEAIAVARDATLSYFGFILDLYRKLGQKASYEYMSNIEGLAEHRQDMEYMMKATPSIMIGTPEDFVEELLDLERRGVDEVLLRVDGFGHRRHMEAIELLGREVIPHVDNGSRSVEARGALTGAVQDR